MTQAVPAKGGSHAPAGNSRTHHVMVDLETLSTRKDAAIIQIAARAFDPNDASVPGLAFCMFISNPVDSGHVDSRTIAWWLQQKPAARIGKAMQDEGVSLAFALTEFARWLRDLQSHNDEDLCLWSHGAAFDIAILAQAYATHGIEQPWSYRAEFDTRTLYRFTPGGMPRVDVSEEQRHDAAYDCLVQIEQLCGAVARLKAAGLEVEL